MSRRPSKSARKCRTIRSSGALASSTHPQIAFALTQRRQQTLLMDVFTLLEAALPRFLLTDTRAHCSELLGDVLFACTQPREFFAQTLVCIACVHRVI